MPRGQTYTDGLQSCRVFGFPTQTNLQRKPKLCEIFAHGGVHSALILYPSEVRETFNSPHVALRAWLQLPHSELLTTLGLSTQKPWRGSTGLAFQPCPLFLPSHRNHHYNRRGPVRGRLQASYYHARLLFLPLLDPGRLQPH